MTIYTLDLEKLTELYIDTIEGIVFDNEMMQPSFSIHNKEDIKRAMNIFMQKIFAEYDVVEIKNKFEEDKANEYELKANERKGLLH